MPVIVTLNLNNNLATSTQPITTNWHNYSHTLQHTPVSIIKIDSSQDAEHALHNITNIMLEALDKALRETSTIQGKRSPKKSKTSSKIETK
ncbi:hypothetical protein CEXT_290401 [Caerostris extrusa]|uniref:Uncharacterized protein n=1 Tax=Caerostris extrusa TaxID=172846 RepID=A0AAV4YDE1_CAEEX|nr:hypothetical protein CEXT_290401 [Caerostris extrusa]